MIYMISLFLLPIIISITYHDFNIVYQSTCNYSKCDKLWWV